jgi:hypothetical protein
MIECPNCHHNTLDIKMQRCAHCGMSPTIDVTDEVKLAGLLHNLRVGMQSLGPDEFQQVGGIAETAFTNTTCRKAHRYLLENGVPCIRVDFSVNDVISSTLIVGRSNTAFQQCLRQVREQAGQRHAKYRVLLNHADADAPNGWVL